MPIATENPRLSTSLPEQDLGPREIALLVKLSTFFEGKALVDYFVEKRALSKEDALGILYEFKFAGESDVGSATYSAFRSR